jgi:hypothetical protein
MRQISGLALLKWELGRKQEGWLRWQTSDLSQKPIKPHTPKRFRALVGAVEE